MNEFLVRQMSSVFSSSDIELWQAAVGAANGNHASKDWARALPYYELALAGVRRYYHPYCGYLGSFLEKYSECLLFSGKYDQVRRYVSTLRALCGDISVILLHKRFIAFVFRREKLLKRQNKS